MVTLRASLISGGSTENEVDIKIQALNAELGPLFRGFMIGTTQPLINTVNNSSELTAGEKAQFITDLT